MEQQSKGYKNCLLVIEKLKETGKNEFEQAEIRKIIAQFVGMSKLSQIRYLQSLLIFNLIYKKENGNYVIRQR